MSTEIIGIFRMPASKTGLTIVERTTKA